LHFISASTGIIYPPRKRSFTDSCQVNPFLSSNFLTCLKFVQIIPGDDDDDEDDEDEEDEPDDEESLESTT
jgi:hypothetical protein